MREISVPDINYEDEVKKCKITQDVVDKNGLMQRLLKDVIQQLFEAEMDEKRCICKNFELKIFIS